MKVLLTGGHGFIGQHLVESLKSRGDQVLAVDHRDIPTTKIYEYVEDADAIYHLSAYGNMIRQIDVYETFKANLENTLSLLYASLNVPYKAFINVSSSSVMLPHQTMYSATKMGGEYLCKAFVDEYDKPIVNIRPYSVYGESEAGFRFIPTVFRSCILGEEFTLVPDAVHDWVYVKDVVSQMIECVDLIDDCKGTSLNVGTGYATRNSDVVNMIENITGKKANYTLSTKPLRSYDNENWVNKMINPKFVKLEEGLRRYYESIK